jgi:hypothetical protein
MSPSSVRGHRPSSPNKVAAFESHDELHSMIMTPSLEVVIKLNNEGVRLYENNDNCEAASFFQLCLEEIFELKAGYFEREERLTKIAATFDEQRVVGAPMSPPPLLPTPNQKTNRQQDGSLPPILAWSKPLLSPSSTCFANTAEEGEYPAFLFSRALFLYEQKNLSAQQKGVNFMLMLEICTSTILFNKALVNHISAVCGHAPPLCPQENKSGAIWNIQYDYKRSFDGLQQICNQLEKDEKSTRSADMDILILALFNNMGVLFCNEMARFREASECFSTVSRLTLQLGELENVLSNNEISSLFRNAWMVPKMATPAA